ncbi:MAG: alanine racemase [Planctomycetes bacterium]|nr:alanine racemase [Planctomycetota bacterium]
MSASGESAPRENFLRHRPRSWAEIDLGAFRHNLARARSLAPGGQVLAVLKADAYGHGALAIATAAQAAGAAMLGVGDSSEALELRRAGVEADLLVLGGLVSSEIPSVIDAGIIPVVHGFGRVEELEREAAAQQRRVRVHLKVDTGMGRMGMNPSRVKDVARRILQSKHVVLDGVMSHLAGAWPQEAEANRAQLQRFAAVLEELHSLGANPRHVHIRNSSGLLDREALLPGESLVRVGACLYGFSPAGNEPPAGFKPVLSLRTQIVFMKDVQSHAHVGYGGTFSPRRRTRLAIIPLGYHDGVKRGLANRGHALVRGRRAPLVGAVSMDYSTLDVTDVASATVGDMVTLIGRDGCERQTVEHLAAVAGTIPYDVLCGLGRRVVRIPTSSTEQG